MPYRTGPAVCLHVAARTDLGRCRAHNEDSFRIGVIGRDDALAPVPVTAESHEVSAHLRGPGFVLGVYDGCGGLSSGSAASTMAAETVHAALCLAPSPRPADVAARLGAAVEEAGRRIWTAATTQQALRGMGTTATVALMIGWRLEVAQVGDSRAYLLGGGGLRQITLDDTLLRELVEKGQLSPEEVASFPHRNVITKALGVREQTQPTVTSVELNPGDRLLLCSDGLTTPVGDGVIGALLREHREPDACCRALVEATYRAGAPDNVTMIVADVTEWHAT
jgi:PPM family protein phosphatase